MLKIKVVELRDSIPLLPVNEDAEARQQEEEICSGFLSNDTEAFWCTSAEGNMSWGKLDPCSVTVPTRYPWHCIELKGNKTTTLLRLSKMSSLLPRTE